MANYKSRYAERTCVDYHLAYEGRNLNSVGVKTKMAASFRQFSLTTVPSSVVATSLSQTPTHKAPNRVRLSVDTKIAKQSCQGYYQVGI